MGILRRRLPKQEATKPEENAASLVYERIEITVEREWVATVVRGRPETGCEGVGGQNDGPEKAVLERNRLKGTEPANKLEGRNRS